MPEFKAVPLLSMLPPARILQRLLVNFSEFFIEVQLSCRTCHLRLFESVSCSCLQAHGAESLVTTVRHSRQFRPRRQHERVKKNIQQFVALNQTSRAFRVPSACAYPHPLLFPDELALAVGFPCLLFIPHVSRSNQRQILTVCVYLTL